MRSISLITSFFILSVSFADDIVLEWETPDSLKAISSWLSYFSSENWDYDNDGEAELILKNDESNRIYVYHPVTHTMIWSYQPSNPDLRINYGEGFGNITDAITNEMVYVGNSIQDNISYFVVVNTSTNTDSVIFSIESDNWSHGDNPIIIYDIDKDGKDEIIINAFGEVKIFGDGTTALSANNGITQPANFKLAQNFPNPFNPATTITYKMPQNGNVNVSIYNIKGELVEKLVDGYNTSGKYSIQWNPKNISSGQYFYQISVDGFVQTKKMVLLK